MKSTKQLLNAGRGHQACRKAAHCLRKEVGKIKKMKKETKELGTELHPRKAVLKREKFPNTLTAESVPSLGSTVQFSSVAQSCPTLCDPMNRSTPGLPVHHQLPEFTQTHVHHVGDAIQPSHSLLSPSPPAPNPSQHQSLFQ